MTTTYSMNTVIHAAFRRDLQRLTAALRDFPGDSHDRAADLHRAWRHYANRLHQHHEGEEELYFPALSQLGASDALLAHLESEHDALLASLHAADAAMDTLFEAPTAKHVSSAREALAHFQAVLETHLDHEERDLEPVARQHAGAPPLLAADEAIRVRHADDMAAFFAWLLDGADAAVAAALRGLVPPPALRAAAEDRAYARVASVWRAR